MGDIHDCEKCGYKVYMDNAENCIVCDSWFCGACDYKCGTTVWSDSNSNSYYICKDCLEQGLDYINTENMDDVMFSEEEYNKAM